MSRQILYSLLSLALFQSSLWSSTNSVPMDEHFDQGVVQIRKGWFSRCSAAVVGYKPLTLLTALHCLGNFKDGGVSIVPSDLAGDRRIAQSTIDELADSSRWPRSTRAFVSPALRGKSFQEFKAYLEEVQKIEQEHGEVMRPLLFEYSKAQIRLTSFRRRQARILDRFEERKRDFRQKKEAPTADDIYRSQREKEIYAELLALQKDLSAKYRQLKGRQDGYLLQKGVQEVDIDMIKEKVFDLAVVVFDEEKEMIKDTENLSQLILSRRVLPISDAPVAAKSAALIIGYGNREIDESNKVSKAGQLYGSYTKILNEAGSKTLHLVTAGLRGESDVFKTGLYGAALDGDSGSPLLRPEGVIGVTSTRGLRSIDPKNEEQQTKLGFPLGWPEHVPGKEQRFIVNRFVNVLHPLSQQLFDLAEAEGAHLLRGALKKGRYHLFDGEGLFHPFELYWEGKAPFEKRF